MAIHEDLPGIEACICVDGQPLQEYHTENDEVNYNNHAVKIHQSLWTVTKYIESQTDKAFIIKLSLKKPYIMDCGRLQVDFKVDGQWVYTVLLLQDQFIRNGSIEHVIRGPETNTASNVVFRPMKFEKIETSKFPMDVALHPFS